MQSDRFDALSRSLSNSTSRRGVLRLVGVGIAGTAIGAVGLNSAQARRRVDQSPPPLQAPSTVQRMKAP